MRPVACRHNIVSLAFAPLVDHRQLKLTRARSAVLGMHVPVDDSAHT
jgi:hypothetical protein